MLVRSKLKYIQTLGQKKFRQQEKRFIAEGPKLVAELLAADNIVVEEVLAVREWIDRYQSIPGGPTVTEISDDELHRISQMQSPQQVLAVVQQQDESIGPIAGQITLALDTIQDPGNMGTIIRIADWFGVQQILCSPDAADRYNPKVVQASMGSIARVRVAYRDLSEWIKEQDVPVYATVPEGTDIAASGKIKEGIIIIGNESKGISPGLKNLSRYTISIPRHGKAESLNAAVATGIILSHIV